jgi:hypothetical protein
VPLAALLSLAAAALFQTATPAGEQVILKTVAGRQLFPEDIACGDYFWRSEKADRGGAVMIYYFFGSPDYGKSKLGLYRRDRFRIIVDESRDPPTARVLTDDRGAFRSVEVRMTGRERSASAACFR